MTTAVRFATGVCLILLMVSTAISASLEWNGSSDNNWGTAANWSPLQIPSTTSGLPDDLTFGTQDLNAHSLSLGTNVFYVNDLTVGAAGSAPDFATPYKDLANYSGQGKLVLQALGDDLPSITAHMLPASQLVANPTTGVLEAADRDVQFNAPLELQADTLVERVGATDGSGRARRLVFNGPVSGNGNLTLKSNASARWYGAISWYGNNTFTGDVTVVGGSHLYLRYATAFGNSANQITLTKDGSTGSNFEFSGMANGSVVPQNVALSTEGGWTFGLGWSWNDTNPSAFDWDCTWSGDFTGGKDQTHVMNIWARDWRRQIFTGTNSTIDGYVGLYDGTEVILGGANAQGVAWENIDRVTLNSSGSSGIGTENTTALLLRGSYTFRAPLNIGDIATPTLPVATIGQTNDGLTAYDAVFTGKINVLEDDYQALNLYAEAGGTARFQGNVFGTKNLGFAVNRSFNEIEGVEGTEGKKRKYASPTGTVIIDASSRVALTDGGSGAIGPVTVHNGTLQVDTANFFAASVTVNHGAALAGTGTITAPVSVAGILSPGASPGTLAIADTLTFDDGSTFRVELGGPTPGDGPGFYDQVNLTNPSASVVLDGSVTLDVSFFGGFIPDPTDTFFILTRADSDPFSTFFIGLAEGATIDFGGGVSGQITYLAHWTGDQATSSLTGGNDLAIYNVQVPEPSTVALLLLGLFGGLSLGNRLRSIAKTRE